jgi:hypothetical protein
MGYPRSQIVDLLVSGFYHCISRCVRRAFLCGGEFEHRRRWIEDRLAELIEVFAIRLGAYAILSNHLHLVVKTEPEVARDWDDLEVARRWESLYPRKLEKIRKRAGGGEAGEQAVQEHLQSLAANKDWVQERRSRLSSLSWLHRLLKEPIARRANAEDDCTGHFWEGRFKSYKLLDEGAVVTAMVYVDLNLWKAGMSSDLADCEFSSLLLRMLEASGKQNKAAARRARRRPRTARQILGANLIPTRGLGGMSTREYVSLVAHTAGVAKDDVDHGARLRSMDIDQTRWPEVVLSTARLFGSVVGGAMSRLREAERRGARHVVNALDVFDSG